VKGTLHWVSIKHAIKAEIRLYDRLFLDEAPDSHGDKDFIDFINPNSLTINNNAFLEPSLAEVKIGDNFQFQRLGYFNVDTDSTSEHLVFNRTVALKDSWTKKQNKKVINQPKEDVTLKEIMVCTGKYLKSREEEERLSLIATVFELSKKVPFSNLLNGIKTANSNKDFLSYLMILNSENVQIDFSDKATFELIDTFVGEGLKKKNSYVRFQAVDCIGKYQSFKENHVDLLRVMAVEDKNTHIIDKLKDLNLD